MSEVKAVQEEVVPEKRGATESVTEEPAAAPQNAAADQAAPKPPAKATAKNTEQKTTVLKKDAVKTKGQKAEKSKPAAPPQATPGIVNLNEVAHPTRKPALKTKDYEETLSKLQIELVKLQEWIKFKRLKVVVVFEGRDAAGKGGTIKRITESLSPRVTRVAALPAPTDREQSQWYFQRYVQHLPAGGEMVLFDRSWYNRAGVERVMGFCTEDEYREFLRSCPEFERMLVRSGIILIKYWFSVSNEEQERRFQKRIFHPEKHWKLSPMDLESRARWVEYSKAKDAMFAHTDIKQAPWYVVDGDDKKRARLNVITHLLNMIDYEDLTPQPIVLPPRQDEGGYVRPPITDQTFIPEVY
jgi:polyphosphate kinase 2